LTQGRAVFERLAPVGCLRGRKHVDLDALVTHHGELEDAALAFTVIERVSSALKAIIRVTEEGAMP